MNNFNKSIKSETTSNNENRGFRKLRKQESPSSYENKNTESVLAVLILKFID
jgi:hypothetical protein